MKVETTSRRTRLEGIDGPVRLMPAPLFPATRHEVEKGYARLVRVDPILELLSLGVKLAGRNDPSKYRTRKV
jgi:hypothetical protein